MSELSRRQLLASAAGLGAVIGSASLAGCSLAPVAAGVGAEPALRSTGAIDPTLAQSVATRVLGAAARATSAPGADGDAARAEAFSGDALTIARADARIAPQLDAKLRDSRTLVTTAPQLLAVSRGPSYPRAILASSALSQSGLPVLALLTTPDVHTPYTIAFLAPMLGGANLPGFDSPAVGSVAVSDASALAVKPGALFDAYAAALGLPAKTSSDPAPFTDDAFAQAVREGEKASTAALNDAVSFTVDVSVGAGLGGLQFSGGRGAIVFAILRRVDTYVNRGSVPFTPEPAFSALTGANSVAAEASMTSLLPVAFALPSTGQAALLAADRHPVAGQAT